MPTATTYSSTTPMPRRHNSASIPKRDPIAELREQMKVASHERLCEAGFYDADEQKISLGIGCSWRRPAHLADD